MQLLQCTSGQEAGPQVSWDMVDYGLTDVLVENRERLASGQGILFIELFSIVWTRDIWAMIKYVDGVQGLYIKLLSSWTCRGKIHSSNFVLEELRLSCGWNTSTKTNTKI